MGVSPPCFAKSRDGPDVPIHPLIASHMRQHARAVPDSTASRSAPGNLSIYQSIIFPCLIPNTQNQSLLGFIGLNKQLDAHFLFFYSLSIAISNEFNQKLKGSRWPRQDLCIWMLLMSSVYIWMISSFPARNGQHLWSPGPSFGTSASQAMVASK